MRMLSACTLILFASATFAGNVPLKNDLPFDKAVKVRETPITFIVPSDFAQKKFEKKIFVSRFTFPIGASIVANTESALRANFAQVKVASTLEEAKTTSTLEAKSFEVKPKLPSTTFGTYTSVVKLVFVYRDSKAKVEREITVTGDGGNRKHAERVWRDSGRINSNDDQLGRATDVAMLDALEQLIAQLDLK